MVFSISVTFPDTIEIFPTKRRVKKLRCSINTADARQSFKELGPPDSERAALAPELLSTRFWRGAQTLSPLLPGLWYPHPGSALSPLLTPQPGPGLPGPNRISVGRNSTGPAGKAEPGQAARPKKRPVEVPTPLL